MSRQVYETNKLAALEAIRNASPVWTETILLNGVGAAASVEALNAGNRTFSIVAPTGYKGKVVGVNVYGITTTFTTTTTPARVDVGTASYSGEYYTGGSIGAAAAASPVNPAGTFRSYIPGASTFVITLVAPTGGSPDGRARFAVTIQWVLE